MSFARRWLPPAMAALGGGCGAAVGYDMAGPLGAAVLAAFGAPLGATVAILWLEDHPNDGSPRPPNAA